MTFPRPLRPLVLAALLAAPAAAQVGGARETAALAAMQNLAQAQDTCAAFTTFYVSLETLDDVAFPTQQNPFDYLNNNGGTFVLRPSIGRFETDRRDLVNAFNEWTGPYVTYQPGTIQPGSSPYDQGSPLDPWGSPYLFYSPLGLIRGDAGVVTPEFHGDAFDRYTIASLGADGLVSADDLFYQFGGGLSVAALSSVTGAGVSFSGVAPPPGPSLVAGDDTRLPVFSVPRGALITLRGVNLGADPAGAQILAGATDLTPFITDWRALGGASGKVEIDIALPPDLLGDHPLLLRRDAAETNPLLLDLPDMNAVADWRAWR